MAHELEKESTANTGGTEAELPPRAGWGPLTFFIHFFFFRQEEPG